MKYFFYTTGIFMMSLGIALTIESGFGASPFDALLVGLANQIGLTVGSWEMIIALIMVGGNSLLSKTRPEFKGLLTAFIAGLGIDLWLYVLQAFTQPEMWLSRLLFLGFGLLIVGAGIACYLQTQVAPIPMDRLMLLIRDRSGMGILLSRTLIQLFFLLMAFLFHGPIGIGTLLTVCLGGAILQFFMPYAAKLIPTHKSSSSFQ
ncbi:YczE/YyaS/YitT family protein [Paenibacillus sp. Leaf72]|uniref:YczE/YyaS/YitT family protein n=1 Tax=Paenibacillus sp. Leaf72 TaxID=1736234 RepID=UPI0006FFF533|nr:hypothetical protein [Paenibacillus sp. Leaf72]KQO18235.1 hypothetical protein ASF12_06270 [Paenibacillus sp. Leaf72]